MLSTPSNNLSLSFSCQDLEQSWPPIRVDRAAKQAAAPPPQPPKQHVQIEQKMQQLQCNTENSAQIVHDAGPPSPTLSHVSSVSNGSSVDGFHRARTRSGVKNLQDSTFKLTGEQIDDSRLGRTNVRVAAPPGGKSSGIW